MYELERHLTDEELLLAVDGELPDHRQAPATVHLEHCETCRARCAQFEQTIGSFLAAYRGGDAESSRQMYARGRLRSRIGEITREWEQSRSTRLSWAFIAAPRWLAAAAAIAAAVLLAGRFPRSHVFDPERAAVALTERDALPVPSLTPGATLNVGVPDLCAGAAPGPEDIPLAVRRAVLHDYGMENVPADEYELDYLITPELGGAPDPRNLWPQRYSSRVWNARVKDQLEWLLPQLVCDRQVPLEAAQREIALNWIAAYRKYFKTDTPLASRRIFSPIVASTWARRGRGVLRVTSFSP